MPYPSFNAEAKIPETGYLRLPQIIGNPKADPPIPPLIPIGRTSWLDGVKSGKYPKNIKLSPRVSVWRVEDIKALIEKGVNDEGATDER